MRQKKENNSIKQSKIEELLLSAFHKSRIKLWLYANSSDVEFSFIIKFIII
jgi:hypothetical protein